MPYDITSAEIAFEAALANFKTASAAFKRSKSQKNKLAYAAASEAYDSAAQAFRDEQDRGYLEDLRAKRMALTAPRRELRARQSSMEFA